MTYWEDVKKNKNELFYQLFFQSYSEASWWIYIYIFIRSMLYNQ